MRDGGTGNARRARRAALVMLALGLAWQVAVPGFAAAQQDAPPLQAAGLLRAGLRIQPEATGRSDGFELFDARAGLRGQVGIVFEYLVQGEFGVGDDLRPALGTPEEDEVFRLLDARLTAAFLPEAVLSFGQFKAPFGREATLEKGGITFLERSLASRAIAPMRNVGVQLSGETLDQRLTYAGGIFNGNGRRLENDGDAFLWVGRAQYNSVGPIEFYDDLVVQVGASLAFSRDSAAPLGPDLDGSAPGDPPVPGLPDLRSFHGNRFLVGADLHGSYRGFSMAAEYLRADLEALVPPGQPGAPERDLLAEGWYLQAGYTAWGAIESVVRWDAFQPVQGPDRDFLLFGFHLTPGFYSKLGLQYAVALDGSPATRSVAGSQFIVYTQLSF